MTTIGSLLDDFLLATRQLNERGLRSDATLRTYESCRRHNFAAIEQLDAEGVTPRELRLWLVEVAADAAARPKGRTGIATANGALRLLDSALKLAEGDGLLPRASAATRYVKRLPQPSRDRVYSEAEIAALWKALRTVEGWRRRARRPSTPIEIIRLLALTGQRASEIRCLRWSEVDLGERVLRLAKTKTTAREVPLSDQAVEVLLRRRRVSTGSYVFATARPGVDAPWAYLGHVWRLVVGCSGIEPEGSCIHIFRHTLVTNALRSGEHIEHVSTAVGHRSTRVTRQIYGRPLATPGARAVLERHAARVAH